MVYAGVVLLAASAALVALYRVDVASDHLSLNDALQVFGSPSNANPFKDTSALARSAHVRIGSRSLSGQDMDEVRGCACTRMTQLRGKNVLSGAGSSWCTINLCARSLEGGV